MYEVDDRDTVVELSDAPQPDVGAPLPHVIADDYRLRLAYLIREPDPAWDGSYVNVVGPNTDDRLVADVRFEQPYAHMFGPPNDEAFYGHPLAKRGLYPYGVFEVQHSSWLRRLERMNAVHQDRNRQRFLSSRRHFVFAFHDTTFECIAQEYAVELVRGSLRSVCRRLFGPV